MNKGKLIVIYGANNLGKSLQVEKICKTLSNLNIKIIKIKYPIYDLEPTGPIINSVLRKGKKLPESDVQKLYAQNRRDYEKKLNELLNSGTWVIAEDYIGTGIAWGMVRGLDLKFLEEINKDLYPADLSLIMFGEQFEKGIEKGHRNEIDNKIWKTAQKKHLFLAERYKWEKIFANQSPEDVHKEIVDIIKNKFFERKNNIS